MPQTRRKVPFSGKKKKEQLLAKRKAKSGMLLKKYANESDDEDDTQDNIQKLNYQSKRSTRSNTNKYALEFYKESKEELAKMEERTRLPLEKVPEEDREVDFRYFENYDFPIRPEWNYNMSREELDRNEHRYFTSYVQNIKKKHLEENRELSLFELNLETWRQLWRVLEMSDILLFIVDVRFSALMFPVALHNYIIKDLGKKNIIILNKIDLVGPEIVAAWRDYFINTYPDLSIVLFASHPFSKSQNQNFKKHRNTVKVITEGVYSILKECKSFVGDDIDLSAWEQKILEELKDGTQDLKEYEGDEPVKTHEENYMNPEKETQYKSGILTLGCIGFPNVGKSSLINALKGRKVVSVSRTPGHTKHFQTIFITKNVKLCDCPGLVFPSSLPKYVQVLLGSYPIAQLRKPYNSINYVAERVDLPKLLGVKKPPDFKEWSAIAICEAWALKKGFFTAKASRPDHYRAANNILRMILAGRITFEFYPPNYCKTREKWINHPELEYIKKLQGENLSSMKTASANLTASDSNESSDESTAESNSSDETDDEAASQSCNTFEVLDED